MGKEREWDGYLHIHPFYGKTRQNLIKKCVKLPACEYESGQYYAIIVLKFCIINIGGLFDHEREQDTYR